MAKRTASKSTGAKTAAQRAGAKSKQKKPEVLPEKPKSSLAGRVLAGLVLTFLALFLLLSMLGVQGAVLAVLRKGTQGLIGYGFYLLPFAFLLAAWRLVFRNHESAVRPGIGLALTVISFSALLHVIFCYAGLGNGIHMVGSLWFRRRDSRPSGAGTDFLHQQGRSSPGTDPAADCGSFSGVPDRCGAADPQAGGETPKAAGGAENGAAGTGADHGDP